MGVLPAPADVLNVDEPAVGARPPDAVSWPLRGLVFVALVLGVVCIAPPFADTARTAVWAEALQFSILGFVVPPLVALAAPWSAFAPLGRLVDAVATRRRHLAREARSMGFLATFVAAVVCWRLPASVNALARTPGLAVLEACTLVPVGVAFWLELVDSPPLHPRTTRPQRIALSAVAMWSMWILAYLLGLSHSSWFHAYRHVAGRGLSLVADQALATGILWAASGLAFAPIVFVNLIRWLSAGDDPDEEIRDLVRTEDRRRRAEGRVSPLDTGGASGSHA